MVPVKEEEWGHLNSRAINPKPSLPLTHTHKQNSQRFSKRFYQYSTQTESRLTNCFASFGSWINLISFFTFTFIASFQVHTDLTTGIRVETLINIYKVKMMLLSIQIGHFCGQFFVEKDFMCFVKARVFPMISRFASSALTVEQKDLYSLHVI